MDSYSAAIFFLLLVSNSSSSSLRKRIYSRAANYDGISTQEERISGDRSMNCCNLSNHATRNQTEKENGRELMIAKECDEIARNKTEGLENDGEKTRVWLQCRMDCYFQKYHIADSRGKFDQNATFHQIMEKLDLEGSELITRGVPQCWNLYQEALVKGVPEGQVCNPGAMNFVTCVNDMKLLYCDEQHKNKSDRCVIRTQELQQKYNI